MDNLFSNLFRWARRQDENFLTEAFSFMVNHLLDHEREAGIRLLRWLCFGVGETGVFGDERPEVSLQFRTDDGVPDIKVASPGVVVLVEVKKGSGLGKRQLERYRSILSKATTETKRLVLLTHHPVEFKEDAEKPDRHVTWHEVGRWLTANASPGHPVSAFLVEQFTAFLEQQRMAVQHVGKEYVAGMEAYIRLVTMIDRALDIAQIPTYKRPRAGKGFWVFYVGSKTKRLYCVRIKYRKPTDVRFEFFKMKCDKERFAEQDDWKLAKDKPYRVLELDGTFFESDAQEQLMKLKTFFHESHEAAKRMSLQRDEVQA